MTINDASSMYSFRDTPSTVDPELLRINRGDTVLYDNTRHIVLEVGMRWLRVHKEGDPETSIFAIKKSYVVKVPTEQARLNEEKT